MSETNGTPSEFEESVERLRDSWMGLFGVQTGRAPGPQQDTGPQQDIVSEFLKMQQNLLGFATAFAEPMRLFVESQQELSKQVSQWAESQRDLADIAAAWAQSQRKVADLLSSWVSPENPSQTDG